MMKKTLAAHMIDIMKEKGVGAVHLGEVSILDECIKRSGSRILNTLEPKKRYQRVLNALEKSPFFIKDNATRPDKPSVKGRIFWVNRRVMTHLSY